MDALSQVLRSLRLRSSIYAVWDMTAPWGLSFERARYAPFHLVESGSVLLILEDGRRLKLEPGDVSVIFDGSKHRICDAATSPVTPIMTAIRQKDGPVRTHRYGGGGRKTRIICGKFVVDESESAPALWRQLPGLLHIRRGSRAKPNEFPLAFKMLADELRGGEPGGERAAALLTETLFIQVMRAVLSQSEGRVSGWLEGLRDPQIGVALALIHGEPEKRWTLEMLARRAGLSRSVFAERFHDGVGVPPMTYLAEWRLQLAARWLRETSLTVAEVGQRLGYRSAAAFHRAFKNQHAVSPTEYRKKSTGTQKARRA
jgi:AraC-like DNA-binding protein